MLWIVRPISRDCLIKKLLHHSDYVDISSVIRNVYPDPSEVFDTIIKDDRILERAASVTESYDDFINSAHQYDQSNWWKPEWKNNTYNAEYEEKELKRKLYRAVANVNILEGIRFYVSFACSFAFGELKLMEGSAKIISLIARDENQHLVLTQNILKNWKNGDDPVMQEIMKEEEEWTYKMFDRAVNEEKKWADYLFSNGSLLGLNADVLKGYIEWLANTRLRSLGYDKIFDQTTNPIGGWLNSYTDSSKVQVAPQETEISSYKIGARDTEINEQEFDDFDL